MELQESSGPLLLARLESGKYNTSLMHFSDQQHQEFLEALNATMPFGKYKGHKLYELPGHYLAWFHRQGFPENKLGRQLALVFELDHNGLRAMFKKYINNN